MARGRARPAVEHLSTAAACLGRPAPSTRLDCLASLLWQLLVLLLDRLGLLSLLTRLGGKEARAGEARWEAAETYHRLHQVRSSHLAPLTCHQVELCTTGTSATRGLALALTALNLSRPGPARPRLQAEMLVLLAARLRLSWPRLPRLLQRRALGAAAAISAGHEVEGELAWLVGAEGRAFFLAEPWSLHDAPGLGLTAPPPPLRPVAAVAGAFRHARLAAALQTLNRPSPDAQITQVLPHLTSPEYHLDPT